jgi:hypothetical protein
MNDLLTCILARTDQRQSPVRPLRKISDMIKTQPLLILALAGWAASSAGAALQFEPRGTAVIPQVQSEFAEVSDE